MLKREVLITGAGVFTPFGFGEEAITNYILKGIDGFRKITSFDTSPYRSDFAAVSDFSGSLLELGIECTSQALKMAGLSTGFSGAVFLGTNGDFSKIQQYSKSRFDAREVTNLFESVPAFHSEKIAEHFDIRGERLAFTNACVASSNAIGQAYDYISRGYGDIAVCGGYFLVNEEFMAKFNSGRALSQDGKVRPFSGKRSGLLLGDGAAMFVLESRESAERRNVTPLAAIAGWALICEAYHVCQPHPEGKGMALAIEHALSSAGMLPSEIDYINAHGTGTIINDKSETHALKQVFKEHAYRIPVSSTKSMTGHILEGTGAVETAICLYALKHNTIPPTANYETADEECDLDYVPNIPRLSQLNYVINLNASFGGNNSAIILKKIS